MSKYTKKLAYQYFMVTLACAIMGIALNVFYLPNKLLSGGIGGIAVLGYHLAGLPMGAVSLVCNIPLFFLSYKFLDKQYTISALYGMVVFAASLDFFHFFSEYTVVHDTLLACIAGGVLYGIGAACMYRVGGSSGGTDIIGAIIQRRYSISISTTGFMFNIGLLTVSAFYFGIEPALYTLLTFFVMMKTCNTFTAGFDYKKNIIIISDNHYEIAEAVIKIVGRGVTYLHGEGAFTHQQRQVIFVVAKLTQLAQIRSIVRDIDPRAFMIIHDVNDVFGRGFTLKASGPQCPRPQFPEEHCCKEQIEQHS